MEKVKRCNTCREIKELDLFYSQKNGLYGKTGSCKECRKKDSNKWGKENKERKNALERSKKRDRKEYNKKWREKNPEYFIKYRERNKLK